MISPIRPRTAPAAITLRSAACASPARSKAAAAISHLVRPVIAPSLRLETRRAHNLGVFGVAPADQLGEIRAALARRIEANHEELLAHGRHLHGIREPFCELVDRSLRRAGRHHGAEPDLDVVAGETLLRYGRKVR